MDKDRWLAARRSGIGGSDIAAILGVSPWRTPLDVWRSKLRPDEDQAEPSEAMQWGLRLEAAVADHWAQLHGARLARLRGILRHPEHPWAIGTPDRVIAAPGLRPSVCRGRLRGAAAILEIKTASTHAAHEWIQGEHISVPAYYVAQCMWYLAVSGIHTCHMAALIGGQRYIESSIERDDEVIAEMLRIAGEWWRRHIIGGEPPAPQSARDVLALAPRDSGRAIEASTELADLVMRAAEARARKLAAERVYETLAEQIQMAMGDASTILLDGRTIASWRASRERRITDWEAVARELAGGKIPEDILARHTQERPGARRFLLHVEAQLPRGAEPPLIAAG